MLGYRLRGDFGIDFIPLLTKYQFPFNRGIIQNILSIRTAFSSDSIGVRTLSLLSAYCLISKQRRSRWHVLSWSLSSPMRNTVFSPSRLLLLLVQIATVRPIALLVWWFRNWERSRIGRFSSPNRGSCRARTPDRYPDPLFHSLCFTRAIDHWSAVFPMVYREQLCERVLSQIYQFY